MSLIESALERLRRNGEAVPPARVEPMRRIALAAPPTPPAIEPSRAPDDPSKRLTLDLDALRNAGYLPERGLERRFADHYRQIKRPLIDRALSGSAESHLILVTSALPGDGKTFTSINLALSMARERDISVVLVDADTPRARVSEVLGLRREPGLLDALRDESLDVDSLIRRTDIRGLEVLPAGTMVENATELLASTRMAQVAARICGGSARRLAIFDSAPLLVSSESRVLCRLPGQLVLVVRAGVTPKHALLEAIGHLDKTRLQGVILNQTPFRASGGYYGYSQYGEDAEERQRTD